MLSITKQAKWLKQLPPTIFKLGAQLWIDKVFPRHLFIETTSFCNLSCSFCPREQRHDFMELNLFTQIVDEASQYGARSFSHHLFGESLLYPKWEKAIQYTKSKNKRHSVLITTNGTTLNAKVDDLIAANPDLVLWSWRPEVTFTPATKEKLRKWGKFRVRFIEEVTPKEAYVEWAEWPNVEGRKLHNYVGNIHIEDFNGDNLSTAIKSVPPVIVKRWPCYHLWLAPAVAWNGNILMCCADPHQKEVLGKFPDQSVHDVWTGERLRSIREGHLKGEFKGICASCDVWKQYPNLFFGHTTLLQPSSLGSGVVAGISSLRSEAPGTTSVRDSCLPPL